MVRSVRNETRDKATQSVTVTVDGVRYEGSFHVDHGMITVRWAKGFVMTGVRNKPASTLAKALLLELINEERARQGRESGQGLE